MTLPAIIFGFILSTLFGVVFHLFLGGGFGRLVLFIILAWVGFWIGQMFGNITGISLIDIGPLHLGMGTISCWLFLGIGNWLSQIDIDRNHGKA